LLTDVGLKELTASLNSRRGPPRFARCRRLSVNKTGSWSEVPEADEIAATEGFSKFVVRIPAFTGSWTIPLSAAFDSLHQPSRIPNTTGSFRCAQGKTKSPCSGAEANNTLNP